MSTCRVAGRAQPAHPKVGSKQRVDISMCSTASRRVGRPCAHGLAAGAMTRMLGSMLGSSGGVCRRDFAPAGSPGVHAVQAL